MTPNLNLPYLLQNQAQKHVTLNESLRFLDQLVQSSCEAMLTAPPASPVNGNCFIVLSPATDEWAGHENAIAGWYDGAWQFAAPQPGWRTFVRSDSRVRYWSGTSWDTLVSADGKVDQIGVNTSADATNRLAVFVEIRIPIVMMMMARGVHAVVDRRRRKRRSRNQKPSSEKGGPCCLTSRQEHPK